MPTTALGYYSYVPADSANSGITYAGLASLTLLCALLRKGDADTLKSTFNSHGRGVSRFFFPALKSPMFIAVDGSH